MANGLTGGFDAVVQVSVETINRLLATLHQNGVSKEASPSFPHSSTVHVGETAAIIHLGHWAESATVQVDSKGTESAKAVPPPNSPPGAKKASEDAIAKLAAVLSQARPETEAGSRASMGPALDAHRILPPILHIRSDGAHSTQSALRAQPGHR